MPLTPYNPKTFVEYFENMRNYLILNTSGLTNFEIGSRIRTLLEAIAYELSRSDSDTLRGFLSAIREGMYNIFGFERKDGTKAIGYITITRPASIPVASITYPIFQIDLYGIGFTTTQVNTMGVGVNSIVVEMQALQKGIDGNILVNSIDTNNGQGTIITDPAITIYYDRIYNHVAFQGGTEQESDGDREARFQAFIGNLGKATAEGIKAEVLKNPNVLDCVVISNVNPYTGLADTGWVSVYITDGTVNPPLALVNEIKKVVEGDPNDIGNYPGCASAGVRVFVGAMTVLEVDVSFSLEVYASSSLTSAECQTLAISYAYKYINYLPMGEDVLVDTLQAYILRASDDFYKVTIADPLANVTVPSNKMAKIRNISCLSVTFVTPA